MTKVNLGALSNLEEGKGKRFDVGDVRIAAFRIGDDVHVIADRCSHAEASLAEGDLVDTEVECPRHGALFDVTTGESLTLPATKPVARYDAAVVDGDVHVTIDQEASA